jgi:hypothetical protein
MNLNPSAGITGPLKATLIPPYLDDAIILKKGNGPKKGARPFLTLQTAASSYYRRIALDPNLELLTRTCG